MTTKSRSFLIVDMDHAFKNKVHELAKRYGYRSTSEFVRVFLTAKIQEDNVHKNTQEVTSNVK